MNDIKKVIQDTLDWLSDLPEDEIRRRYQEMKIPQNVDFVWEIGGTEYTVTSHLKRENADDIVKKIGRLLEDEVAI